MLCDSFHVQNHHLRMYKCKRGEGKSQVLFAKPIHISLVIIRVCLIIHCTRLTAPLHPLFEPNFINVGPLRLKNLAQISRKVGQSAVYMNYQTHSGTDAALSGVRHLYR